MSPLKNEFPAGSAIFHATKELLFNRSGLAFKIYQVYPDQNDRNLPIANQERLTGRLFERMMQEYNNRLRAYNIQLSQLTKDRIHDFNLVKFKLNLGRFGDDELFENGGSFRVFPSTFACKRCGHLVRLRRNEDWGEFNPRRCQRPGCSGEYEQISLVHFCEKCGDISELNWSCKNHPVRLVRGSKDSLITWKVTCAEPGCPNYNNLLDISQFQCTHPDPFGQDYTKSLLTIPPSRKKPMTVTEGAIFLPVTDCCVDIPNSTNIALEDLEYILLGMYLRLFQEKLRDPGLKLIDIRTRVVLYNDAQAKKLCFSWPMFANLRSDEEREKLWRTNHQLDEIQEIIDDLKFKYPSSLDIQEINDFAALSGSFSENPTESQSYANFLGFIVDELKKERKMRRFDEIKSQFGISDLIYIPRINLILSCYGHYHGVNKFWDPDFVPHFEPIWEKFKNRDKMLAYAYPYETEGILITLQKDRICRWLFELGQLESIPSSPTEASRRLMQLDPESPAYKSVQILIHTFSHILIRQSSVYTGLDTQSCSEMIFPRTGALFIYSTSSINIGGFQYIFEHEIEKWFTDIWPEVRECTLDPSCAIERGACFSCLYLPEFVCRLFNKSLDRDVFLGKKRFSKGFWGFD